MLATGYVLSGLIGIAIIILGLRFFTSPAAAARDYGVPGSAADGSALNSFLAAKGLRDIVSGLVTFALMANGIPHVLGEFLLIASLIAFGDAMIVSRSGGQRSKVFGVHGAAGLFMVITALILILAAR